jgi:putative transposase
MGFIDTMRADGHAVESTCRVLREQGCQVAARTYRAWRTRQPAARTISDAQAVHAIRDIAWTIKPDGRRQLTPEGLYGRRKMTAYLRRTTMPTVSFGAVDRAMKILGLSVCAAARGYVPRPRPKTVKELRICWTATPPLRPRTGYG